MYLIGRCDNLWECIWLLSLTLDDGLEDTYSDGRDNVNPRFILRQEPITSSIYAIRLIVALF